MGRHRKPSTSSRSVARIAITGAVIGGGGLGMAAQANAATDSEWDTVARCESSGNWAINTGNGYQGGLQFAPSTWAGHGGTQFAAAANLASRDQQIAIAEKVLATQGKGAWPVCGRGLSGATPRTLSSTPKPDPAPKNPATVSDAPGALADMPLAPLDNPAPLDAPAPLQPAVVPGPAELEIITIGIRTPEADVVVIGAAWEAPGEDGVAHLASQRTPSS